KLIAAGIVLGFFTANVHFSAPLLLRFGLRRLDGFNGLLVIGESTMAVGVFIGRQRADAYLVDALDGGGFPRENLLDSVNPLAEWISRQFHRFPPLGSRAARWRQRLAADEDRLGLILVEANPEFDVELLLARLQVLELHRQRVVAGQLQADF